MTTTMLRSVNIMGTVMSTKRQMQAFRDGNATCVLKTEYTQVKRWVKWVALHAGKSVRNGGWTEELVARLRKGKGGCVLGPFTCAQALWDARQGGACFKLGMSFGELQGLMQAHKRLYVYRFYPAEVCPKIVWNDVPCITDDWSAGFVRCRNVRGRGVRFYVKNEPKDGMLMRAGALLAMQAQRKPISGAGAGSAGAADSAGAGADGAGNGAGAGGAGGTTGIPFPPAPTLFVPVQVPRPLWPLPAAQAVARMAGETREVVARFRTLGQQNGLQIVVVIALEMMELALGKIDEALEHGRLRDVVLGLYDLKNAVGEYGWSMEMIQADAAHIERVKELYRHVGAIEMGLNRSVHPGDM